MNAEQLGHSIEWQVLMYVAHQRRLIGELGMVEMKTIATLGLTEGVVNA